MKAKQNPAPHYYRDPTGISMDAVFHLDAVSRAEYLQLLTQSVGCSYICLWSYSSYQNQPKYIFLHSLSLCINSQFLCFEVAINCFSFSSCLIGWDGYYTEENTQPVAFGLFLQYRQLIFPLENNQYGENFLSLPFFSPNLILVLMYEVSALQQPGSRICFRQQFALHSTKGIGSSRSRVQSDTATVLSGKY